VHGFHDALATFVVSIRKSPVAQIGKQVCIQKFESSNEFSQHHKDLQ